MTIQRIFASLRRCRFASLVEDVNKYISGLTSASLKRLPREQQTQINKISFSLLIGDFHAESFPERNQELHLKEFSFKEMNGRTIVLQAKSLPHCQPYTIEFSFDGKRINIYTQEGRNTGIRMKDLHPSK